MDNKSIRKELVILYIIGFFIRPQIFLFDFRLFRDCISITIARIQSLYIVIYI